MNTPRIAAWETTRRCELACRHCRGSARDRTDARELTADEGSRLVASLAELPVSLLILTGGEPMSRPDIYDLARNASERGLRVVMATCGDLLTPKTVGRLKGSGVSAISVSLDGADAKVHDEFRGVSGAFEASLRGLRFALAGGLPFQINTTVTRLNIEALPDILDLAEREGASALDLFFLVPTGRGRDLADLQIDAGQVEDALNWACDMDKERGLRVKVTCAPQMARVMDERGEEKASRAAGCMAGRGFIFVSHTGIVQPCGFLDIGCGDLRDFDLDVRALLDSSRFLNELATGEGVSGKCGRCGYLRTCGGCRARAFASDGDALGPEPFCVHNPGGGDRV